MYSGKSKKKKKSENRTIQKKPQQNIETDVYSKYSYKNDVSPSIKKTVDELIL